MVLLTTTPPILTAIEALPPTSRHDFSLPDTLKLEDPISHDQLIRIARYFRQTDTSSSTYSIAETKTLNSLLRGTKVYIPPPPKKPEPSPEYLALKARLLAAAETDAYNRMTSSSTFSSSAFFPPSSRTPAPTKPSIFTSSTPTVEALHNKSNNNNEETDPLTPGLVLNIFLSVLITGFSVYWALRSFRSPEMLVSTVEVAKGRERRVKERKVVVESERVGGKVKQGDEDGAERVGGKEEEVIWGRGVNGGLRRRVREKWEEKEKNVDMQRDGSSE
ncbi:Vesicle coat protein involved in Golgi to plasma membrane transport family protein [Aspergillus niger]|uniref:Vesicle coat protein involved in Golgi to plasma membrane transport family protein n=1 Tax=Aspergillus niger TaxID=5061 RepID=A0A505I561_ASPNG|nr:Vesicle coat protein involved in Golgi to plasma membrane transport family protein [Aspergillus niger]